MPETDSPANPASRMDYRKAPDYFFRSNTEINERVHYRFCSKCFQKTGLVDILEMASIFSLAAEIQKYPIVKIPDHFGLCHCRYSPFFGRNVRSFCDARNRSIGQNH
ncbi:MAG: hypothetical protein ACXWT4_07250 [Methylobacter sp.]